MVRKAIRSHLEAKPKLEVVLPFVKGNVGFVFTNGDLANVRKKVLAEKVAAPAKAGSIAPVDVTVPKGPTSLEPTKTSFFQALNINTKINKGQIEIVNDVQLVKKGDKVGTSEATLLQMLNIKPFSYGLITKTVYDDGVIYDDAVLQISDDDILNQFRQGVNNIAAVSLQLGIPTVASIPHSITNGFKNVIAIGLETNFTFKQAEKFKHAASQPQTTHTDSVDDKKKNNNKEEKKEEKKEEEKKAEEEDIAVGDLFGGDF